MSPIEKHNDLTIRRYSVVFVVMIFAATFMPTKFFWLPPVALFCITVWLFVLFGHETEKTGTLMQ